MNFTRKFIVLMVIMLIILVGCTKTQENVGTLPNPPNSNTSEETVTKEPEEIEEPGEPEEINEGDEIGSEGSEDELLFEVKDSPLKEGWKVLKIRDYAYTTEDWDSYSFQEASPLISYELHFPGNWDIEYSVFVDENGQKVAELLPPIIMKEGQTLLDNWQLNRDCELIVKEDIKVGNLTGARIVYKAFPHGGHIEYWYPHTYYLTDGKRVFAMSFYTLELDEDMQRQFDGIIGSFTFLE